MAIATGMPIRARESLVARTENGGELTAARMGIRAGAQSKPDGTQRLHAGRGQGRERHRNEGLTLR